MPSFIRRILYAGYWFLVAFAFTYSGYCYFRAHDISSPRDVAVSSSSLPVASPESQEQGQVVESSEPAETVSAEPLLAAPTVALQEVVGNAEPTASSDAEFSPLIEEPASVPEPALPAFSDSQESAGEASVSPAPESSVAVALETEDAQDAQDSESAAPPVASNDDDSESHSQGKEELGYELGQISIGEIRVGYRTPGTNPEGGDGQDESIFENEPHYVFTLRLAKEDGSLCTARLLRSLTWMRSVPTRERRVSDGRVIGEEDDEAEESQLTLESEETVFEKWLNLEDFGCVGWAEVISVEDFTYRPGPGNLVTGTFEHTVNNLVNLCVEGQEDPIGCTPNHPFWSADREEFVEAGELFFDERVKLLNGETKRVVQRYPRPGPEKVYNLEVFGEHVYHVTSDGILVHNYCVYVQIANIDPKGKGYVGRTINFVRRKGEHARNGRTIAMLPGFEDVSYEEMRYAEDQLIRKLKKRD